MHTAAISLTYFGFITSLLTFDVVYTCIRLRLVLSERTGCLFCLAPGWLTICTLYTRYTTCAVCTFLTSCNSKHFLSLLARWTCSCLSICCRQTADCKLCIFMIVYVVREWHYAAVSVNIVLRWGRFRAYFWPPAVGVRPAAKRGPHRPENVGHQRDIFRPVPLWGLLCGVLRHLKVVWPIYRPINVLI